MPEPTTASIYVRLSKEAGASNLSRDGMLTDCRALASRHGLEVVAEHVDDGVSGAIRHRPAFQAWLEDGRSGRAGTLIAWAADRMTREGVNAAALVLDVIEGKDGETGARVRPPVRLLGVDGSDSREGDAFRLKFVIAAEIARGERERIKARSKRSHQSLTAAGRYRGGWVPFGYSAVKSEDGKGMRLVVDPDQAAQLRSIYDRLMSGETVNSVVMDLNRQEVLCPFDQQRLKERGGLREQTDESGSTVEVKGSWRVSNLNSLMKSPTLQGLTTTRDNKGTIHLVRGEDGHPIQRSDPIFSAEEMARLADILAGRSNRSATSKRTPQPLNKVAVCECGASLYQIGSPRGRTYYRCGKRQATGICPAGASKSIRTEEFHVAMLGALRGLIGSVPRTRRSLVPGNGNAAALERVNESIETLREDRSAGLFRGPTDEARFREQMGRLLDERERLQIEGVRSDSWEHVKTGETWGEWLALNESDLAAVGEVLRSTGIRCVLYAVEPESPTFAQRLGSTSRRVGLQFPRDFQRQVLQFSRHQQ